MDDIRILLVEDSDLDAELIAARLRAERLPVTLTRALTREQFEAACDRGDFDVILCDYSLPAFDGPAALAIARERCPSVPFIFVSGMLGEEIAIDVLKRGAMDYVLKQRLERLGPAVRQAVAGRRERAEREEVEAKLRAAEHRYRLLVDNLEDYAVVMVDFDGRVTSWNVGAQRVLGYAEQEILGRSTAVFFTPEDRAAGAPEQERQTAAREGRALDDRWHVRKDGTRFFASGVLAARHDETGRLVGFSKVFRDITDRWRAEQEARAAKDAAEAANRAKDRFLAVLSHELRTPLSPILATVQALELEEGQLSPALREAIDVIKRNAELEARLIDDLLDLTRVTRGKLQIHPRPVDAHLIVERAVEICRGDLGDACDAIRTDLRATATVLQADPARLQQILWNLLKNAMKFTPPGGIVRVRTFNAGSDFVLEVADTGIGFEAEALPKIFQAFEQADAQITQNFGGLGLGLAIARSLAELHGGRLEAASEGLGRGATFRLTLPAATVAVTPPKTPAQAAEARARKLRILLVEDHEDTARAMTWLLKRHGHDVRVAGTVRHALTEADRGEIDLLISDIGLPDGTGLDVIRQLPHRGIPAIALTGFGMENDVAASLEAGFTEHLTKPVNFQKLEAVIHTLSGA
jgi:PAS domain S-box-containing protein